MIKYILIGSSPLKSPTSGASERNSVTIVTNCRYVGNPVDNHKRRVDSLSDHAIMLKIKAGDLEKLNLLYHRYSRRMFGFFYRMTHDGSSSEDLVQNVFMRVLKYKHTYSDTGQFESWLFQLARNVHHDHYRKSKRYSWQEDMSEWESHLQESNNVETRKEKEEEMSMLMQALDSLSPEKKELIELTRFQRMKYGDVANMLNITESAVKVRVHRVLKELREKYLQLELSN